MKLVPASTASATSPHSSSSEHETHVKVSPPSCESRYQRVMKLKRFWTVADVYTSEEEDEEDPLVKKQREEKFQAAE